MEKQDLLNQINEYLKERKLKSFIFDDDIIAVSYINDGNLYYLKCVFPEGFPNIFPEIYLSDELYDLAKDLPHIGSDKKVCTFDPVMSRPNRDNPCDLAYKTICQAIDILNNGFLGTNFEDYNDEFFSYWEKAIKTKQPFFIFGNTKDYKTYCYITENNQIFPLENKSYKTIKRNVVEIDSSDLLSFDFTMRNFVKLVGFEKLKGIDLNRENLILCKIKNKENIHFSVFKLPILEKINGFNYKNTPVYLLFKNTKNVNKVITCYSGINFTQDYLFKRGGDGKMFDLNVLIFGCGSVGSHFANFLTDYGITKLTLVDPDILTNDNIARHLCGFRYVLKDKVTCLSEYLLDKNHNIICKCFKCNGYKFIKENDLSNYDLIVDATADTNFLLTLNELKNSSSIKKIISLWVEPFCSASHALTINNNIDLKSLFIDNNFKYNVLLNGTTLNKRLSGCQSTYFQYGAISVKMFLSHFVHFYFACNNEQNFLYSYIGDLNEAKQFGCVFKEDIKKSFDERIIKL